MVTRGGANDAGGEVKLPKLVASCGTLLEPSGRKFGAGTVADRLVVGIVLTEVAVESV